MWRASILLVALFLPLAASAEEFEDILEIEEVEVEGEGVLQHLEQVSPGEGEQSAAALLGAFSRVFIRRNSKGEAELSIRGLDERQASVTIDGLRFSTPYEGKAALGVLPASWFELGELQDGSWSGAGLGGGVDFRLREPGRASFEGGVLLDPQGAASAEVFHGGRAGSWRWLVGGGLERNEGWTLAGGYQGTENQPDGRRINSDSERTHFLARGEVSLSEAQRVDISVGFIDGEWGIPPSVVAPTPRRWRFSEWRHWRVVARHILENQDGDRSTSSLWVSRFDNLLDAFDDDSYRSQEGAQAFRSHWEDIGVGADWRTDFGLTQGKLGALRGRVQLDGGVEEHRGGLEDSLVRGLEGRAVMGVVALSSIGKIEVLAGLSGQLVDVDQEISSWAPDGVISGEHPVSDNLRFNWSFSRRVRYPTLKERTPDGRVSQPPLTPESSWGGEAGWTWWPVDWLEVEGEVFYSSLASLIEVAFDESGARYYRNLDSATLMGAELGILGELGAGFVGRLSGALLSAVDSAGEELIHRPGSRGVASLRWRGVDLEFWCQGSYTGEIRSEDPFVSELVVLGETLLLDAGFTYSLVNEVALWARGENLGDTNYQTSYGYPAGGRRLTLGVKVEL